MRGSDKYRFLIAIDGVNFTPVKLVKSVSISGSKNKSCADYVRESSEWKIKYSESPVVYTQLLAKIKSPSSLTNYIMVKIEYYGDWETLTGNEFLGVIQLSNVKVNEDEGILQFTPKEYNKYLWYEAHKDDEKDLASSENVAIGSNELFIDDTSFSVDFYIPGRHDCAFPPTNCIFVSGGDFEVDEWHAGTMYYGPLPTENEWQLKFWVKHNGKRYYCYRNNMGVAGIAPGANEPGVGGNWTEFWKPYDYYPHTNQVWHVRQQRSLFQITAPGGLFVKGNDIFQGNFTNEIPGSDAATNCPSTHYCFASYTVIAGNCLISSYGNVKLFDLFDYLLTGSGLTFDSQFFSSATNPVTGTDNKFKNIYISIKSFIKNTADESTKCEITLDGLISDICETINGKWHIDDVNNKLIIEHVNYYKNGRNYTGTPEYYADLTDKLEFPVKYQTIEDLNSQRTDQDYNFNNKSPDREIFKPTDSIDTDNEIKYSSYFRTLGEKIEHARNRLSTDLLYVIQCPDKTSDDDFLLLSVNDAWVINRRNVTTGGSPMVYVNHPNGDLFFDNLIRDFWIYDRYFETAIINADTAETTFLSMVNFKMQKPIRIPRVSDILFDPLKLIFTHLGDGEVESFEIDTDTDWINVKLAYSVD